MAEVRKDGPNKGDEIVKSVCRTLFVLKHNCLSQSMGRLHLLTPKQREPACTTGTTDKVEFPLM